MDTQGLKGKKIGIIGFGVEGQAVADFLHQHQIPFSVLDKGSEGSIQSTAAAKGAKFFFGEKYLDKVFDFEILFRSPGVKYLEPQIQEAKKRGIIVTSQIKYFFDNSPAQIIGVTGTKGKGTTSKLIQEILVKSGRNARLAGNFGTGVLELLDELKPSDFAVLELSSFQLHDLEKSPNIAVVLMVTSEHLDYHKDVSEYVDAKASILKFQTAADFAVVNSDFENSAKIGKLGKGKKYFVQTVDRETISDQSKNKPFDVYKPEDYLKIKNGVFAEELNGGIYFVRDGQMFYILNAKDVALRGFHNIQNIAAAITVAKILEIDDEVIAQAIREYKGLPYRLELVREKNGIEFFNDSIGTTPESTMAAIRAFDQPVIAVVGGFDKKGDYAALAKDLAKQKNLKAIVLIGDIGPKLKESLVSEGSKQTLLEAGKSMPKAFELIRRVAQSGDVVVLAAGTSSFDMYKNYKERGADFSAEVMKF